jgi:hypothetical protein
MTGKRANNEKLHKSQRMWYINFLINEVDEAISYIVSGMVVISSAAGRSRKTNKQLYKQTTYQLIVLYRTKTLSHVLHHVFQ